MRTVGNYESSILGSRILPLWLARCVFQSKLVRLHRVNSTGVCDVRTIGGFDPASAWPRRGRAPSAEWLDARGVDDPGFVALCRLVADGRAWTKLSGADRNTEAGPSYRDIDPFVEALVRANPERLVWGTDWPHINYFDAERVPDDGALANLLARWLPDERVRHRVLVDNPAALYDFDRGGSR